MFRKIQKWCFGSLILLMFSNTIVVNAQDGGALFGAKCANCHQPHKDGTGPKLFKVRDKWSNGGAKEGSIYNWVNNWEKAAASDPYAMQVSKTKATAMSYFPELSKKDIDAILDWVDEQAEPSADQGAADGKAAPGDEKNKEEESGLSWTWILLGIVFITIIMAVGGVRRQIRTATIEEEGLEVKDRFTYIDELKSWAWKYRLYVGLAGLVMVLSLFVTLFLALYRIGVVEGYQPSQPIAFPHAIHAGTNGIDCKYCHSSVTKSKSAGIPSVNVCMNCHKHISGQKPEQKEQIAKLYGYAGWEMIGTDGKFTGNSKPIAWNKVHVLPDHVYFNHQQHVVVGGIDCKQCHGDMTKHSENQKVWPVEEINALAEKDDKIVKLTKPTLTMGWCIECHGLKEVSSGSLDTKKDGYYDEIHKRLNIYDRSLYEKYLADGKVTVKELGGWECAKCHY
jgi:mono/diheme cytochrome c family protein